MSHEKLIAACFQWHWNTFPSERQMLFGINNNTSTGLSRKQQVIEGNKNKAKGVVAGVLDFCYIMWSGDCVFLDGKVGNDRLSDAQIQFTEKLDFRKIKWITFSSLEEFQIIIHSLQYGR